MEDMRITVGLVVDNPTFMFDGRFEITTTDDDGTVHTLYESHDDFGKDLPAEILVKPITYMVLNNSVPRLRLEVG